MTTIQANTGKSGHLADARCILAVVILSVFCLPLKAQTELEYKMEIGGMLGGSFYMGDANTSRLYKDTKLAGGAFARYNLNPRMSLKANLLYGGIAGEATNHRDIFGDVERQDWKFNNSVVDLSCTYEMCFWAYGTGMSYKGTKRLVPYIQMGLGTTYGNKVFTVNFPVGFGVKYKLKDRLNIGLDWTMHVTLSDKLDGIADPFKISSGFLKNTDCYSLTMFYVSYDFFPKLRKCNND